MAKKLFVLPEPTKKTPKQGQAYFALNIDRSAKKLNSFRILRRVWNGNDADQLRHRYNNIFTSVEAAKAARADMFKALANHS